LRGKAIGTTLVVAALLGVGSLVTPTSVMAGHEYPVQVQAARDYALKRIGSTQFQCLHNIVERESGWNPKSGHPSGPYGLGQANPGTKMRSAGRDWLTNPVTQMKWLLRYIHGHGYGTACNAWAFWRAHGWF
jgi:hypothetical protein